VRNVAAGKEPSGASGELWIDGLRRFIASGYTYQYRFRKKSRRNQKASAITIVFDNMRHLFCSVNLYHTMATIFRKSFIIRSGSMSVWSITLRLSRFILENMTHI
jgi:hypothetical protein